MVDQFFAHNSWSIEKLLFKKSNGHPPPPSPPPPLPPNKI